MLGLDNPIHILFILVVLLLVFGAKRLPEMGRSMGAGLRGFKESISGEHSDATLAVSTPHRGDDVSPLPAANGEVPAQSTDERTPVAPAA